VKRVAETEAVHRAIAIATLLGTLAGMAFGTPLTAREQRWIDAGRPVLRAAREHGLSVDIVVQPTDEPDASPIALGIRDGRCQIVLSMRGNPGADALSASIGEELFPAVVEAVFAHELAHCWRWSQGAWHALPAGFADAPDDDAPRDPPTLVALRRAMRETRREEAYADLVGLAWTRHAHPQRYGDVRTWLQRFRGDALPGDHHDTEPWLRLAPNPEAFGDVADPFLAAQPLWERGLRASDGVELEPPRDAEPVGATASRRRASD
jgi:hypothetical protein